MNEAQIELVALEQFRPSPTQPRHLFRPEKLKELEDSMRTHGFLSSHPIAARVWPELGIKKEELRNGERVLEIVEGESRWRAAKAAGLTTAPVVVEELSDQQVIERQMIENLIRSDLTPIEEAEGYQRMLNLRDETSGAPIYTRSSLAARLGRSEVTIAEQLTLLALDETTRAEVEAGRLPKRTAYLIGRLPSSEMRLQAAALILRPKFEPGPLSYLRAEQEVEKLTKDLRSAPFDRNDAELVPVVYAEGEVASQDDSFEARQANRLYGGPCSDCPFAVVTKARSLCTNPSCFEMKVAAEWLRWEARETRPAQKRATLSRAECEKMYRSDNQLVPSAGFVDLAEHPDGNDLRPGEADPGTWRTLIAGAELEITVVRDRLGKTRELVRRDLAIAAASAKYDVFRKADGGRQKEETRPSRRSLGIGAAEEIAPNERERWLDAPATAEEIEADKKRAQQERAASQKLDEATLVAVLDGVGVHLQSPHSPTTVGAFLRLIIAREIDYDAPHAELLKKHHLPVGGSVEKQIAKWGIAQSIAFLVELFITEGGHQADVHEDDQRWLKAIFGVDYRAVRKLLEKGDAASNCSRTHCKNPAEPGFKMCAHCREKVAANQRQKRAEGRA